MNRQRMLIGLLLGALPLLVLLFLHFWQVMFFVLILTIAVGTWFNKTHREPVDQVPERPPSEEISEEGRPSYAQGYQAYRIFSPHQAEEPQPHEDRPGGPSVLYEQPLVQYPEQ